MLRQYIILFAGIFACATAANLIKASHVDPVRLAAYRVLVAAVALGPVFVRDWRRNRARFCAADLVSSIGPGLLLGLHFISFLLAVRMTSVANASLLVNLTPAILPFFSWALSRERVTGGEVAGTVLGLSGVALLVASDFRISRESFVGDLVCLGSMVFFAWYMALGRVNRHAPTVWLYIVPVYAVAGLFVLPFGLARPDPPGLDWAHEVPLVLALGLVPTVIGHGALNYCVRHMRSQVVALANLAQFIFAALIAWGLLGEIPHRGFYVSSVLLIAGAVVAIRSASPPDS